MVILESIAFDHVPGSATRDALSIRQNFTTSSTTPEWRGGLTLNPEQCRVAYAMVPTRGNPITVQATFRRTASSLDRLSVRTFNPNDTRATGCLYAILLRLGFLFVLGPPRAAVLNALGEVKQTTISFDSQDVVTAELELRDTQIWNKGVGVYDDTWHWQYLGLGGAWIDFEVSKQRVYVVIDVPKDPWTQTPGPVAPPNLPWTEVLDFACNWARGQITEDGAAVRITERVLNLGQTSIFGYPLIAYDCVGRGRTNYSVSDFDLTSFIDRLRGGVGRGHMVNCTDCAAIVSTFANALGCDLWQSRIEGNFKTNPIRLIGSSAFETLCKWKWDQENGTRKQLGLPELPPETYHPEFIYHEVAWKGLCTEDEAIFDACLEVKANADPAQTPPSPLLLANILFGRPGDGTYRDRLATTDDVAICQPVPASRKRRPLY